MFLWTGRVADHAIGTRSGWKLWGVDAGVLDVLVSGATAVFTVTPGGKALTFEPAADGFHDRETATHWNLLG